MSDTIKGGETSVFQKALEEVRSFLDVPIRITVRLGDREMRIREILQLAPGSLVELPKSAGENVDVYANGSLLGYGEVLELEGTAGIRLTDFNLQS